MCFRGVAARHAAQRTLSGKAPRSIDDHAELGLPADRPIGNRDKRHQQQLAQRCGHPLQQEVIAVEFMTGDVHLRHQWALDTGTVDGEVNMRCAPRVRHRADGAEAEAAIEVGDVTTVALEAGVAGAWPRSRGW